MATKHAVGSIEYHPPHVGPLRTLSPGHPIHTDGGTLRERQEQELANFLGWFSLGLGAVEVLAPRALARAIGIRDERGILPLFGWREIATGIGILTQRRPTAWLWGRVAGDAMDLAYLAAQYSSGRANPTGVLLAAAAVAGVTVLDLIAAEQHGEHPRARSVARARRNAIHVYKTVTINRSAQDLYNFWHRFEKLPTFMRHLKSVEMREGKRSHWVAYAPAGQTVEWDAETIDDEPGKRIAWRSTEGGVENSGAVRFQDAPGGRGTEVSVELDYRPPGGVAGAVLAQMFGEEPEFQILEDLRKFKQVMETGEVAKTEGQPTGRGGRSLLPF
jgi:uncharacterized membrane protein